jgi:hypothetical protein
MTTITVDNIPTKAREAGSAVTAAVPQSVSQAAQKSYDTVVHRVQWYLEQWEDVVEEARAMRAAAAGLEALSHADFLASLPEAKVVSDIPGRLRVRAQQLKGQQRLAEQCTERLAKLEGISEVHVSPLTGSVLTFYDSDQYKSAGALLGAIEKA